MAFNVCPRCGEYAVEKVIDPAGPFAICPACGHPHPFRQLPLFVVSGASGAGKTTACLRLMATFIEVVCLETDILWGRLAADGGDDYRGYHDSWLRVAKNVGQAGRSVTLFGTALPGQHAASPERRYFSALHYLALVCDDELLAARLRARPVWRAAGGDEFVAEMLRFNGWLRRHASATDPPMDLLDTSTDTPDRTAARVVTWIRAHLTTDGPSDGPAPAQ